jgi:hypothetical protein
MIIDNNTGRNVRLDINDALAALVGNNYGDTEPTTMYPFMFWVDTTTDLLKMRNEANSAWVSLGSILSPSLGALLKSGGTMTGVLETKNAGTVGTPDLTLAGDTDTGWYSPGANLLGLVAAATELLRLDGVLGYVKLLGTKALQLAIGTTLQRPSGVEGLIRANSDTKKIEAYINAGWQSLNDYTGFDFIVGTAVYATHSTLAAAIAAASAGSRILVTANETINATVSITLANIEIVFMPGVTFTQGSATTGISIGASGCKIRNGRFSGFTTAAISIADTFNYHFIKDNRFETCTNDVVDNNTTPNSVISDNISE